MSLIEINAPKNELTLLQRWSNTIAILLALVLLVLGLNWKQQLTTSASTYTNPRAGISVSYPQRWLLDTDGDYVFRIRDVTRRGFKTTIQVSVRPTSPDTTERNIIDTLNLSRAAITDYFVQTIEPFTLRETDDALSIFYTYVDREANPLLESVATVVLGQDIITIQRGQAIIITFRAEADAFNEEYEQFEKFLRSLRF